MDKLAHYRQLIQTLLTNYTHLVNHPLTDHLETHTVFDDENNRYMVFRTGWWGTKRIHSAILYVRLHEGKIWIEEDGTEDGIATSLLEAGVPKEDIVLGFRHPELRPLTEFAVA